MIWRTHPGGSCWPLVPSATAGATTHGKLSSGRRRPRCTRCAGPAFVPHGAVTVQQCSEEARLRGPGLRPDELPADELPADELVADELVAEQDGGRDRRRRRRDPPGPPWRRRPVRGPGRRGDPLAGRVTTAGPPPAGRVTTRAGNDGGAIPSAGRVTTAGDREANGGGAPGRAGNDGRASIGGVGNDGGAMPRPGR